MPPKFLDSADKHGVPRADAVHAIVNATYTRNLGEGPKGGTKTLFIGPAHAQTDREIEVVVEQYLDGRETDIFHVMELGPKFRRMREGHPND